jgi:hypothetical protein
MQLDVWSQGGQKVKGESLDAMIYIDHVRVSCVLFIYT